MKHIKTLRIDIDKKNFEVIPSVQYDNNTRFLHINLVSEGAAFDITGCSVKISATKPDGTAIFNNCKVINAKEGFIEVELTEQINAAPGNVNCEIKIYTANGVLTTKQFEIGVSASITSKEITSSNEFKALTDAVNEIQNIDNRFKEVDSQIKDIQSEKTDKTTTNNLQQQVNNLVLGAVGNGNNAEVVQARGNYSVLNDRLDNEFSTKISKLVINNIVLNSNLDDQTSWNFLLANGSISNNECIFTATSRYGSFYQFSPKNPIIGHKYYISAKVKATSNKVSLDFYNSSTGSNYIRINHSGSGNYERLSTIQIVNSDAASRYRILDDRTSGWDAITCKEFMLVDLTEIFGVGNEPSFSDFEELIYKNNNSYFVKNNLITNAFVSELFPKKTQEKQKYPILLYKNNNDLTVAWKYNNLKDIRIHIEPIGANGLYQIGRIAFVDNDLDYVSDDFGLSEILYQAGVTDWLAPYIMKAINNADGDKVDNAYDFVGGAHSYANTSSGVPTARLLDIQIKIDGNNISSNGVYYAHKINVICTNRIQGNNTKKADGTGREILEEEVTFTVTQGVIDIENKIKPLEQIRIDRYYGLQAYTQKYRLDGGTVYYVNGNNTIYPLGVSNGGTLVDGSCCRKMIVSTNEHNLSLELNNIGLTAKRLINDTDNLAFWNNDKLYFQLINKYTDLQLGDMLYLQGTYRFSSK